ncbi:MAG TPA: MFS transporter, partial [Chroococcales cyanobacterium]
LALLFFAGWITFPILALISLLQGLNNSFDMPARQTFVVEMVERKEDLGSAIALNSTLVNGARMIGPSVGGLLIAAFGEGSCFLLDGLSYFFILGSLFAMRIEGRKKEGRKRKIWPELKEGFRYVLDSHVIRSALLMVALISVMGMPYTVLMPIFATKVLHGGPHALGFLMAAIGVGALGGGLFLASFRSGEGLGKVIAAAAGVFGCGLIAFSLSRSLPLSLGLLLFAGFGMMVGTAGSNTLLQTVVQDDKRARVMSFYALAFMGMSPIGSLLSGCLANFIGAPFTVRLGGIFCILASLFYAKASPR